MAMAGNIPLLRDSKQAPVQGTLLRYGIAPKIALNNAQTELRNFTPEELSTVFGKLQKYGTDLKSFDFTSASLVSKLANLAVEGSTKPAWLKPPRDLIEQSAKERLALCVNSRGEWSLRQDGYFAISHVWEEGIQADPGNQGIPLAHLHQIIQRIHQVGAEWIWLDGLAIPGSSKVLTLEEEELKIAIINNLAAIYRRANSVIIFDALAMQLRSMDYVDVAVCLTCGKWATRVWTFQEIYLAKKAVVLTATGVVDFLDMTRRLRALSGNESGQSKIFGTQRTALDAVAVTERSPAKYEELYLKLVRLVSAEGMKPSLAQIAMSCKDRKTGNDIDYARAFFPVLGLIWKSSLTREEGMELIYNGQRDSAKRLLLMHGSPRSSVRPGWAPSYLTGLSGRPIGPDHPLGDIERDVRGLKRTWYTYKVCTKFHPGQDHSTNQSRYRY